MKAKFAVRVLSESMVTSARLKEKPQLDNVTLVTAEVCRKINISISIFPKFKSTQFRVARLHHLNCNKRKMLVIKKKRKRTNHFLF